MPTGKSCHNCTRSRAPRGSGDSTRITIGSREPSAPVAQPDSLLEYAGNALLAVSEQLTNLRLRTPTRFSAACYRRTYDVEHFRQLGTPLAELEPCQYL